MEREGRLLQEGQEVLGVLAEHLHLEHIYTLTVVVMDVPVQPERVKAEVVAE